MDLKGLVNKAKDELAKNPELIEKGGDAIDKATGGKYAGQVDKAQDAARKVVDK
ncbi:MAG: antitoxin [Gordonia sp. (in: high G+C Gram-positive bacteria)]